MGHVGRVVAYQACAQTRRFRAPERTLPAVNSVLDQAHDPALTSGGETAKLSDPELPIGRFRCTDDARWRIGVLVGDRILDLQRAKFIQSNDMIALMQAGTTSH